MGGYQSGKGRPAPPNPAASFQVSGADEREAALERRVESAG